MTTASRTQTTAIAALTFELVQGADGVIPTEAHLLPPGPFRAIDGRPAECDAWQLDALIAANVSARMAQRTTDTLIDYEHQSLRAETNGQRVPAAGWFNSMTWRDGKGLYAIGIKWVGDAPQMIARKEYRYISAVFAYDKETGEVLDIVSVALTNTPALDGLEALADLARKIFDFNQPKQGENLMGTEAQVAALTVERDGLKTNVAALTAERDGLATQVAALTTERDSLQSKVAAIDAEKAQAALAAEQAKHKDLLTAALTDGRLTPAQKPWAEKLSLVALTEYLDATSPLALLQKQNEGHPAGAKGLSDEELAMCTRMNVTPEDYLKNKQA